jgi:hypothetical protein
MCVDSFVFADHVSLILPVVHLSCSLSKSDKFRDVISISKQDAVKMFGEFGHDRTFGCAGCAVTCLGAPIVVVRSTVVSK